MLLHPWSDVEEAVEASRLSAKRLPIQVVVGAEGRRREEEEGLSQVVEVKLKVQSACKEHGNTNSSSVVHYDECPQAMVIQCKTFVFGF